MAPLGTASSGATPFSPQWLLAVGTLLIDLILAQVALALGNISVLGIKPFDFLTQWGHDLQASASAAYATALGAQSTATTAQQTASATSTTQSQQAIAKPGYLALDATADAVFPISNIAGATPSTINVTSSLAVIGFILTPDNGKKSCIIWLGSTTTSLTAFYINIYKLNTTTGVATRVEASANILSSVSNALAWNYYDLVTPITSDVGYVYAVEIVVVGSGTYKIAGLPSDWKPVNASAAYPQQLGSQRSAGLPTAPSTFTPTYTGVVPWFGLGGFLFAGPFTIPYIGAGTYTWAIPSWLKYGDCVDVILLGGGGGGGGSVFFGTGPGGFAGPFVTQTLIYGIDIPITTSSLTVVVGAGGIGGTGYAGAPGATGGTSSVTGTGLATVSAPGGTGGQTGADTVGYGPGNETLNSATYVGGANTTEGVVGNAPGGGGGGAFPYGGGANGGDGGVWVAAYQAGKHP